MPEYSTFTYSWNAITVWAFLLHPIVITKNLEMVDFSIINPHYVTKLPLVLIKTTKFMIV